jgi:hypothetical protein
VIVLEGNFLDVGTVLASLPCWLAGWLLCSRFGGEDMRIFPVS